MKSGWENIYKDVFICTVCLKDKLIEIKAKFSKFLFAIKVFHRSLKLNIFVSNASIRHKFTQKRCVMSCGVSDDVMPSHARICACDIFSVFPCIRFISNGRFCLKPEKGLQMIVLFTYGWVKTTAISETMIETTKIHNRPYHIIGFNISFQLMTPPPSPITPKVTMSRGEYCEQTSPCLLQFDIITGVKCRTLSTIGAQWSKNLTHNSPYPQDVSWKSPCPLCLWLLLDTGYACGRGIHTVTEKRHLRTPFHRYPTREAPSLY